MRLEGEGLGLRVDDGLQRCLLARRIARGGYREASQQVVHGLGRAGGLIRGDVGGVRVVAEERRALGPQLHDLAEDAAIVVVTAARAAGAGGVENPLAAGPVRQRREIRMSGEQREGDDPLAVESAIGGGLCRRRDLALGKAVEVGDLVEHDREVVRVAEEVLLERGRESGESLIQSGQLLLGRIVEPGACVGHLAEPPLDQVALLGGQLEFVELLVQRLDAPVQCRIQLDRVLMCRHERRELLLDLLDVGRGVGRGDRVERAGHIAQQLSARLERNHRVLERGHRADARDRTDLGLLLGEGLLEGRQVVLGADGCVVRQTVGESAGGQEGVVIRHVRQPTQGTRRCRDSFANRALQSNACKELFA